MGVSHVIGGPDMSHSTQSTFSNDYSQACPLIKGGEARKLGCLFHVILPSKMIVSETMVVWWEAIIFLF